MLKANEPTEHTYKVVVAHTNSDGENTTWETQEITATKFWIDDYGNLRFMMRETTIAAISPGNWQRVEMKDDLPCGDVYIKCKSQHEYGKTVTVATIPGTDEQDKAS